MQIQNKTAVVAVGGNSLILDNARNAIPDQYEAARITCRYIADMIVQGWNVVITHGNGPQVGFILRRSEIALGQVAPIPMDYAGADTQGAIGYMFQKALINELGHRGLNRSVVPVVTMVEVESTDPAFASPSKPIGSFMDEEYARSIAAEQNWIVREDAGRGWRRVVPSPRPRKIIPLEAIHALVDTGNIVVACGGGGIPVVRDESGDLVGVEAVIDKDFASSLLAQKLKADLFLISTGVEKVAVHFNQPEEEWLDQLDIRQTKEYISQGHFAAGSMGPKVEAILDFLENGGSEGLITNPENIGRALLNETGTRFRP
ncbi:MAG TPA: carbamate kinase [Anaerolineales bacterium]|nr:carbamate kinase [Anaerolineales bacterium]